MQNYVVTLMKIGYVIVEAESEVEAENKVYNGISEPDSEGDWEIIFGETETE
jgi:hypothetical protein